MTYDPKPLVAAGVVLLDSHRKSTPELKQWEHHIDLETLDMNYGWHCMLGQLFGHYTWVSRGPVSGQPRMKLDESTAINCGFRHDVNSPISERNQYLALTTEWKRVIEDRLAA
jgi:hypothetical protein